MTRSYPVALRPIIDLRAELAVGGAKMFLAIPDRWYDPPGPKFRCENDHVSTTILKSEERGDLCLACLAPVCMTFPEDRDGYFDPGACPR